MRNGDSSGNMLTTTPSYDIIINWFAGTSMKNTTTTNSQSLPLSYPIRSSKFYYKCVMALNEQHNDRGGCLIIYTKTASSITARYEAGSGTITVVPFDAITIGY